MALHYEESREKPHPRRLPGTGCWCDVFLPECQMSGASILTLPPHTHLVTNLQLKGLARPLFSLSNFFPLTRWPFTALGKTQQWPHLIHFSVFS